MTLEVSVLDQWTFPIEDDLLPGPGGLPWFASWVQRDLRQASRHVQMLNFILQHANQISKNGLGDVYEPFGGIGAGALVVDHLPDREGKHYIGEISAQAAFHLDNLRGMGLLNHEDVIVCGNAYESWIPKCDTAFLDFGDLTASKLTGERLPYLQKIALSLRPRRMILTDIAGRLLHLHRGHYGRALGHDEEWGERSLRTYPDYLYHEGQWIRRHLDYTPVRTVWQRWSSVTLYCPEEDVDPYWVATSVDELPRIPPGLRLAKVDG